MNPTYLATARLLTEIAPVVFESGIFALKGGTAINLFIRDMPRLSRGNLSVQVSTATVRISGRLDDARMRFDARDAAAKIPGVVAVVDAIRRCSIAPRNGR